MPTSSLKARFPSFQSPQTTTLPYTSRSILIFRIRQFSVSFSPSLPLPSFIYFSLSWSHLFLLLRQRRDSFFSDRLNRCLFSWNIIPLYLEFPVYRMWLRLLPIIAEKMRRAVPPNYLGTNQGTAGTKVLVDHEVSANFLIPAFLIWIVQSALYDAYIYIRENKLKRFDIS